MVRSRTKWDLGIANAIDDRFGGTPQHHAHAIQAAFSAGTLWARTSRWFTDHDAGAGASTSWESSDGYRAFLFQHLDWIHKYGTVHDGASADASTCLCPVTAYLQLILCQTPMEDWAAAATESDTSPLAFAWAWVCTDPSIGRQTADVAALVTMGYHAHRLMVDELERAEERRSAAAKNKIKVLCKGIFAALGEAVENCFTVAARVRDSPSEIQSYEHVPEPSDAEGLQAIKSAAEKLGEEGERYA